MAGKTIVVGISGASGAVYAQRLLDLLEADARVERVLLVVSSGGLRLLRDELKISVRDQSQLPAALVGRKTKKIENIPVSNIGASIASGVTDNLLKRAADVHLKEGRPLLLCWRDTPLNTIHLENMLRVARAGGINMPISPGYYFGAKNLDELVTQFCCRVLARLGLPQGEQFEWKGTKG